MSKSTIYENQLKALLKVALTTQGARVLSVHGHAAQEPGWPDLLVWSRRWSGWIELKVNNRKLNPAQRLVIKELRLRYASVAVATYNTYRRVWTVSFEFNSEEYETDDLSLAWLASCWTAHCAAKNPERAKQFN